MSSSSSSDYNAEQAYLAHRNGGSRTQRAAIDELKGVIEELQESLTEGFQCICEPTEGFQRISELVANQTAQIDTLKSRQAVSGAFQAISLVILVLWLMTLATRAIYECITKKVQADQEEKHQEMIEMLEASLARRKAKRRATAKQTCETPQ